LEKSLLITSLYYNGSISTVQLRVKDTFMIGVTPMGESKPNIFFEERRAEEAIAEKARLTDDKPSRRQALIALAIIFIVLAGIVLFIMLR
jgi:hypothetical protein